MAWTPTTVAAADYIIARKPTFGGEKIVKITSDQAYELGSWYCTAEDTGTYTADDYNTVTDAATALGTTGVDLVVSVKEEWTSTNAGVVTVSGTNASGGTPLVGTATIQPPGYVANSDNVFSEGAAFDVVTPGNAKFSAITSVSVSGGVQAKSGLRFLALPAVTDLKTITCQTSIDFQAPFHPAVAIPCGMDGAGGGIKAGRTEQPTFSIKIKDRGMADGLARLANRYVCVVVETCKENLTTERLVLCNARYTCKPSSGDGNDEATQTADGMYEYGAYFFAP